MLILPVAGITHLQCHKTPPSHHRIPHLRSACRRRSHCRRRCHRCRCFPRERCFLKHRGRETKPSDKSFQTQPVTELQISCVYHSRKYNRRMLFFCSVTTLKVGYTANVTKTSFSTLVNWIPNCTFVILSICIVSLLRLGAISQL